jgi:hypothetical protein
VCVHVFQKRVYIYICPNGGKEGERQTQIKQMLFPGTLNHHNTRIINE